MPWINMLLKIADCISHHLLQMTEGQKEDLQALANRFTQMHNYKGPDTSLSGYSSWLNECTDVREETYIHYSTIRAASYSGYHRLDVY